MDLRSAVYKFMDDGRDLLEKLHADDGTSLTAAELRMLKVQLCYRNGESTSSAEDSA